MRRLRFLLLQTRNPGDPMGAQEVRCFARALGCDASAIEVFDLLNAAPGVEKLQRADMLLLGGSGHYSAARESEWLERALDCLRRFMASRSRRSHPAGDFKRWGVPWAD